MRKYTLLLALLSIFAFGACNEEGTKDDTPVEDTIVTDMPDDNQDTTKVPPVPAEPYKLIKDPATTPNEYCIYVIDKQLKLGAGQTAYEHAVGDKICIRCDDKLSARNCDKVSMTPVQRLEYEIDSTGNQYKLDLSDDVACTTCRTGLKRYAYK